MNLLERRRCSTIRVSNIDKIYRLKTHFDFIQCVGKNHLSSIPTSLIPTPLNERSGEKKMFFGIPSFLNNFLLQQKLHLNHHLNFHFSKCHTGITFFNSVRHHCAHFHSRFGSGLEFADRNRFSDFLS